MNEISFRVLDKFPEPEFSALTVEAFSNYETSALLADVLTTEAAIRPKSLSAVDDGALRIGAFQDDNLIGWTLARPQGEGHLHMINSGVSPAQRNQGIYSKLVKLVIEHARSHDYVDILSRHSTSNNAVIVAKLKLGFFVSGFEYSEVYGPLVRLSFLLGDLRRSLHHTRSSPIRRVESH